MATSTEGRIITNAKAQARASVERIRTAVNVAPNGFTVNVYGTRVELSKGYAVGIKALTFETLYDELFNLFLKGGNADENAFVIGGWTNEDGQFFLDKTVIVPRFLEAMELAEANNQEAIWDFAQGSEHRLEDWNGRGI